MKSKLSSRERKKNIVVGAVFAFIVAALVVGIVLTDSLYIKSEDISESMKDAVLHENNRISLFGLSVNPALVSAFAVTGAVLLAAAVVRVFAIPRFKAVPGKFQLALETLVGYFDGQAKRNSPHRNAFLGAYIFAAGVYIFTSTIFELLGIQVVAESGVSVSLPAPLSDINAAIALGCLSYLIILSTAARQRAVTDDQFFALTSLSGTIQLPPQHTTLPNERYSPKLFSFTPPVGMKRTEE